MDDDGLLLLDALDVDEAVEGCEDGLAADDDDKGRCCCCEVGGDLHKTTVSFLREPGPRGNMGATVGTGTEESVVGGGGGWVVVVVERDAVGTAAGCC